MIILASALAWRPGCDFDHPINHAVGPCHKWSRAPYDDGYASTRRYRDYGDYGYRRY